MYGIVALYEINIGVDGESLYSEDGEYQSVELPKGSIEKLIGWEITWEYEPYEMEE